MLIENQLAPTDLDTHVGQLLEIRRSAWMRYFYSYLSNSPNLPFRSEQLCDVHWTGRIGSRMNAIVSLVLRSKVWQIEDSARDYRTI